MGDLGTTTTISARVAQRRVALLLLPLRLWIGVGWLRLGVSKALQPEWFDGTAFTGWLHEWPKAAAFPLSLYPDLVAGVAERAARPLGIAMLCAEIAIGLGLLTGTLTNLALLMAIMLNVNYLLAGSVSPSQYYIVIQVVLLAGGAGAAYSGDRWLSRAVRSVLLTGDRGLVDGVEVPRSLLVLLAVATGGLAVAVVPAVGGVLPREGADDPGFTVLALLSLVALLALALTRATQRASAEVHADDLSQIGEGYGAAQLPPGPQQYATPPPDPWPSSEPPPAPPRVVQDQPTTQFARPLRQSHPARRPADPYAELRDLPPVQQ